MTRRALLLSSFALVALVGVGAGLLGLSRSDDDPLTLLLDQWPVVVTAGVVYMTGMCVYAVSWSALFQESENRPLIALGFLISQPVKYLPGGIGQPIGQITLAAEAADSARRAVVAFSVHVVINVIAALTLTAPLLFLADISRWFGWLVFVYPLLWAALDRRWMARVVSLLGRVHSMFAVADELPSQRRINSAFLLALVAHATMFFAFGLLSAGTMSNWSALTLSVAYGLAWLIGYIAFPAPAGLGAREAMLVVLLNGSANTVSVIKISAVHRMLTLIVELGLLVVALISLRMFFGRSQDGPLAHVLQTKGETLPGTAQDADSR
jgi:hypothetical protein